MQDSFSDHKNPLFSIKKEMGKSGKSSKLPVTCRLYLEKHTVCLQELELLD